MDPLFPKLPRSYAADIAWSRVFFTEKTGDWHPWWIWGGMEHPNGRKRSHLSSMYLADSRRTGLWLTEGRLSPIQAYHGEMSHPFFLTVAYAGAAFHGWQIQSSLRSGQGELWKALQRFDPGAPMPQGTGRTDAGVHARAQGVLIHATRDWEPYRLLAALNAHLPKDLRVMAVRP